MSFGKTVYKWVLGNERCSILAYGSYSITYKKGTVVRAVKNSQGLMCFETEEDAHKWLDTVTHCLQVDKNGIYSAKLIKCQPLTKVYKPKHYNSYYGTTDISGICDRIYIVGLANYWKRVDNSTGICSLMPNKHNIIATQTLKVLT